MAFGQGQVVQPGRGVALGIEARIEQPTGLGAGEVFAAPGLQGHIPALQRAETGATAGQALLVVGVGVMATAGVVGADQV
ncbi:hypothetical protein FQZ97_1176400 [compost metagenome]